MDLRMTECTRHVGVIVVLLGILTGCRGTPEREVLRLYCGAGIRPPVAQIVDEFEGSRGVKIESDYAGAAILLSRIKLTGQGDLYMPGDIRYVRLAEKDGLIASSATAAYFIPVILVAKGNPKGIHSVADLARPGLHVGVGDPEACAIGSVTKEVLSNSGLPPLDFEPNIVFRSLTVNELGMQVKAGKLDATIVWDAIARMYSDAGEVVPIRRDINVISTVPVAVLRSSRYPDLAREFQAFVTSRRGREIFAQHGYMTELPR